MNYVMESKKIALSMNIRGLYPWQAKGEIEAMNQYSPFEKEKLIPLVKKELEASKS